MICGWLRPRESGSRRVYLFDHLVGERQQSRWHGDAKRLGGPEIEHEGKLTGLLDGEIAGLGAVQNFRCIGTRMTTAVQRVG